MMKLNFNNVEKAFNKITMRERLLLFCTVLICTFLIGYFWVLEPTINRLDKLPQGLQSIYHQENKLDDEIKQMKRRLKKDPLQDINAQIAFSMQRLTLLDNQLNGKLVKFIQASEMPVALSKVLAKSPGVKVLSLISLPVVTFNSASDVEGKESAKNIFYKHSLKIELAGDYNAIYHYFLNLETLKQRFYWSAMTYQSSDYPLAKVTIEIYTLSNQQDLISG